MNIFLKPKAGLRILKPGSFRPLSELGEWVPKSSYWLRRLKSGDVEEAAKKGVSASPKKKSKNSEGEQ